MVTAIFRAFTIIPPKLFTLKTTRNITIRNVAIVTTDVDSAPKLKYDSTSDNNTIILKESSINGHQIPITEYDLQHVVQKTKGIMANKAKGNLELQELILVDVIQRLGLEYYFQEDIQFVLQRIRENFCAFEDVDDDFHRFYEVALSFRLLRQGGHCIPTDIYNTLKDEFGKFKGKLLCKDVISTLSEEILSESSNFCGHLLERSLKNNVVEISQATVIKNTLQYPYHKSSQRFLAKNFLQEFEISLRWTKELNLDKDLGGFARIQPFKWCKWSLGIIPAPNMSEERLELAKAVSFIYMVDDIFDRHHTYHELYLFTKAVNRWDQADTKQLPKCMKVCFNALVEMTQDFSFKIQKNFGWNPEQCLQKLWSEQFEAYLIESKWSFDKYVPSPQEYLKNAIVTSGTHIVLAHAFFLLGKGINKNGIQELNSLPPIISSTATILRLWNDAGIHTDRTPDGIDGSYLDCYMKEQKNRSLESARGHVSEMISNAWQCLNEEYMSPLSPFSKDFKLACLNLAKMVPIMYSQ